MGRCYGGSDITVTPVYLLAQRELSVVEDVQAVGRTLAGVGRPVVFAGPQNHPADGVPGVHPPERGPEGTVGPEPAGIGGLHKIISVWIPGPVGTRLDRPLAGDHRLPARRRPGGEVLQVAGDRQGVYAERIDRVDVAEGDRLLPAPPGQQGPEGECPVAGGGDRILDLDPSRDGDHLQGNLSAVGRPAGEVVEIQVILV